MLLHEVYRTPRTLLIYWRKMPYCRTYTPTTLSFTTAADLNTLIESLHIHLSSCANVIISWCNSRRLQVQLSAIKTIWVGKCPREKVHVKYQFSRYEVLSGNWQSCLTRTVPFRSVRSRSSCGSATSVYSIPAQRTINDTAHSQSGRLVF